MVPDILHVEWMYDVTYDASSVGLARAVAQLMMAWKTCASILITCHDLHVVHHIALDTAGLNFVFLQACRMPPHSPLSMVPVLLVRGLCRGWLTTQGLHASHCGKPLVAQSHSCQYQGSVGSGRNRRVWSCGMEAAKDGHCQG